MMKPVSPKASLAPVSISLSRNTLAVPSLFVTPTLRPFPIEAPLVFLYVRSARTLRKVHVPLSFLSDSTVARVDRFLVNLIAYRTKSHLRSKL